MPQSASPVGLARRGVIPQNNSTRECFVCDPVVLEAGTEYTELGDSADSGFVKIQVGSHVYIVDQEDLAERQNERHRPGGVHVKLGSARSRGPAPTARGVSRSR
jgi:hypothetical protein